MTSQFGAIAEIDTLLPNNKRYEETASKIVNLVTSSKQKVLHLITGQSVIVICGLSGSGKTSSIELANQSLPEDEQIAESTALLCCQDADAAVRALRADEKYSYEGAKHVAYSIVRRSVGEELVRQEGGPPVIFIE